MKLTTSTGQSLSILIVEDETVASIELECVLEELGHRVAAVAVTPAIAETVLRTQQVDAVIFGATLVGRPPFRLRDKLARKGIPAAVSSKYPEEFVRILGFKMPYIAKPYRLEDVDRVFPGSGLGKVARAA